jgi:signal transduction histidine kinase
VRPDGGECWLGLSFRPVRDESNGLTHYLAVVTDQSSRKRLEQQLRQAHQLEVLGRMAGGVAHDFNNLLTAILGYSQLLLREIEPQSTSHQNLLQIIQAGERAERLARRLMSLGGERPRSPEPLGVNPVVEETLQLLRDSLGEGVELILALETVSPVLTDPVHLQQVLMNLVLNARDAMPQGGRLIVHTADVYVDEALAPRCAAATAGWYVQLAVSDTGCGMSEEVRARIFEPFFTTKGPDKGTGLGLAVVRDIVRGLGGFIEVNTRPGSGSTFRVYLPRSGAAALVRGASLAP